MLLFNSLRHAAWNHQWRLARRGWCYSMWRCPNRHIIQTFFVRLSSTRRGSRHSSSVNLDITSATGAHIFPHNWYLTVTKSPTLRFPSNARHPQSPAHFQTCLFSIQWTSSISRCDTAVTSNGASMELLYKYSSSQPSSIIDLVHGKDKEHIIHTIFHRISGWLCTISWDRNSWDRKQTWQRLSSWGDM